MSHVADVQMQINDLSCLKKAVEGMGGTFVEGQKTFTWYGRFLNDWRESGGKIAERAAINRVDAANFGKCEHAIKIPGCRYEIGVIKSPDGKGYKLIYDEFGEGRKLVEWLGGETYGRVKQQYSAQVTKRQLSRQGYRVVTKQLSNGFVKVTAESAR
jgi:hypothetical protein